MFPNNHAVETGAVGDPDPRKKHFGTGGPFFFGLAPPPQDTNSKESGR